MRYIETEQESLNSQWYEPTFRNRKQRHRWRRRRKRKLFLGAVLLFLAVFLFTRYLAAPIGYKGLQIPYNRTRCLRTPYTISYLVIHDTANRGVGADAQSHYIYFSGGDRGSSADFFVDDIQALQINDYYHYYTWHCGDGGAKAKINNRNSVGIEICVNRDGNYAAAVENARQLTKKLMKELHIDIDHVVRHRDASGKDCPGTMSEVDWQAFLASLNDD
ncbi:peptidoglycan recognition protein family protein [Ructibacterium gallinarum]|uniref:N-acetylmuramoyl-L-alanine amidase n=1 Tax=Ructibacterium gallinarum TaxID=2779355 RepID=A0A9D5LX61_9FIRM|nr:N-acetylmuramoyl-L-alanine amidase [Ructibacterium gallinarum]MBE5039466.1 N-acetylmuramoyl-L-alanine amidase [Ructibacterium gallinarum]